jgi:hypothetical protein
MASETNSSFFANLDWSKFDFTRWNLDGLALDDTSSTVASLLQKAISIPQWPQMLGSSLPGLKNVVIQHLTAQTEALKTESADLDKELASRLSITQGQIAALEAKMRLSSVPQAPAPSSDAFLLVAKAVDRESKLGLPGLTVQLLESADSETPLAAATTDSHGDAILSLSRQRAASLTKEKATGLTISILNSQGKSLYSASSAPSGRANQVETHIAAIPASKDTASSLEFATEQNSRDTDLLRTLTAKLDQLKLFYTTQKQDIQDEIATLSTTIAAIKAELDSGSK